MERVISSPFTRAYQSIAPLAERLGLSIETDNRLAERVLCATALADWRERLASF
ncbi:MULTISPECIES: histidine phosphatase family protein [Nostoc]|uniref:Histidine phosphatase family protein n=1 Tax=Nostoc paludosum FACHB-159 TaxID=2692908 RepID=A0ABR8KHU9_9NOSO|nr:MULTISPECIES: histidine phosphatase family protein [Nostoc]MBD2682778.1 histidine phosphatase family protein [Nostoc sp. FACHB-857]MBD2739112.1 histidine phosphatase family protein [Nostoc paludosum FACHB-159]